MPGVPIGPASERRARITQALQVVDTQGRAPRCGFFYIAWVSSAYQSCLLAPWGLPARWDQLHQPPRLGQSDPSAPLVLRNRRARIIPQAPQDWHCALHTSCAGRPGWSSRTGSPRCRGRGRDPAGVSVRLVLLAVLRAFEPAGALPRVCRSIRPVPAPGAEMGQSQVYHTGMTWHALVGWLAVHSAGEDDGWALSVSDWSQRHPTRGWAAHLHLNVSLHATQHACALATPAFHIRLSGQMRVPEHPRKKKTWKSAVGCGPC